MTAWPPSLGCRVDWCRVVTLRVRRRFFHGLRKSAVVFLLDADWTDAEVYAIAGQSREMVERLCIAGGSEKVAAAAIPKGQTVTQHEQERMG